MIIKTLQTFSDLLKEILWPTKCAICDKYGFLICKDCLSKIKFIDKLKACKKCGESSGIYQCCNCYYHYINKNNYYYDKCCSCVLLDENTSKIVTTFKDQGEIRLSRIIAYFISMQLDTTVTNKDNLILTYIPDSNEAYLNRGFDHMELITKELSKIINIPYIQILERPFSNDQRQLNRLDRTNNMENTFHIKQILQNKKWNENINIILIDDVFTTGATLNSAAKTISEYTKSRIYCLTFARGF